MRSRAIQKTMFRGSANAERERGGCIGGGGGGQEGKYHVHRDIFRGTAPSAPAFIYLYTRCSSYLYVDIFRLDETLPRIIKLAKYFRATTVITQAAARFAPFLTPSLRTDERTAVGLANRRRREKRTREDTREIRVRICLELRASERASKRTRSRSYTRGY